MAGGTDLDFGGSDGHASRAGLGTFVGVYAGFFKRLDGTCLMRTDGPFSCLALLPFLLVMMMLFREYLSKLWARRRHFILIVSPSGYQLDAHGAHCARRCAGV